MYASSLDALHAPFISEEILPLFCQPQNKSSDDINRQAVQGYFLVLIFAGILCTSVQRCECIEEDDIITFGGHTGKKESRDDKRRTGLHLVLLWCNI